MADISTDLRWRAVQAYLAGGVTYAQVAERFAVGEASIDRWLRLYRETGSVERRPRGGGRRGKLDEAGLALLRELVEEQPDATLGELAARYQERKSVKLAICIVHRALERLQITRKKRRSTPPSVKPIASGSSDGTSRASARASTRGGGSSSTRAASTFR